MLLVSRASGQKALDSLGAAAPDTLGAAFSPLSVRLPAIGDYTAGADSLSAFHGSQFKRTDAIATTQILGRSADFFLWDLGEPGQNSQLLYRGLDWRAIELSLDGVPMSDPIGHSFNLHDPQIEFIEDIEVLSPAASLSAPVAAPGAIVNMVSRQYISYRPSTKVRFLQGPYGQVFTDAHFTQNIAKTTNLVAGFQRHATDGRYTNAELDAWNFRSRVRFDFSDRFNLALTYLFTKRVNGTNGGVFVDSTRSVFQGPAATVRYPEATETVWRHDAMLHALASPFADTTATSRAIVYYTLHERDYRDPQSTIYSSPALDRAHVAGLRLEQRLPTRPIEATVGFDVRGTSVTASPHVGIRDEHAASVWGQAGITLFGIVKPIAHVREDFIEDQRLVSYGAGLGLNEGKAWELQLGVSSVRRMPTLQERYWSDPLVTRLSQLLPEKHRMAEATLRLTPWNSALISIGGYAREVEDAVLFRPASPAGYRSTGVNIISAPLVSFTGLALEATLPIWRFGLHLKGAYLEYKEGDTLKSMAPTVWGVAELFFRDTFFNGNLDLKVGARVQGAGRHQGMEFVPHMLAYVENRGDEVGRFASLDLYGVFEIGDAIVSLAWENILGVDYYVTPVHPMLDRSISLGIDWQFLD